MVMGMTGFLSALNKDRVVDVGELWKCIKMNGQGGTGDRIRRRREWESRMGILFGAVVMMLHKCCFSRHMKPKDTVVFNTREENINKC